MQLYFTVSPEDLGAAAAPGRSFSHLAYRIGGNSQLLSRSFGAQNGLLCLSNRDAPAVESPSSLAASILQECRRRRFSGVVLDFEGTLRQDLLALGRCLLQGLPRGSPLYVSPDYGAQLPGAIPIFSTAISGGTLAGYLQELNQRFRGRFALDLQRLRMDFPLPAPRGIGRSLTAEQLQALREREQPESFFSQDLCARYFAYPVGSQAHLVLFDEEETLRRKWQLAASSGCGAAFFLWPEIRDCSGPPWT